MSDPSRLETFHSRLNAFLTVVPDPNGKPWAADRLRLALEQKGVTISRSYLSKIRTGSRDNPSLRIVTAIAEVLEIQVQCLLDADAAASALKELEELHWFRTAGIELLARNAQPMSSSAKVSDLAAVIKMTREMDKQQEKDGPV